MQIARLAEAMSEVGPDVSKASAKTEVPTETARYWYKTRLLGKGFTLHATIAYEKLGLKCIILIVRIGKKFEKHAEEIFSTMHDSCYVESYSRTVPFGYYFISASVPREHVAAFIGLANRMKRGGIFSSLRVFRSEWRRDIPMRTQFYDFERSSWVFNWERLTMNYDFAQHESSSRVTFDQKDLEILKQGELDATARLEDVATKIGLKTHALRYHYRDHVIRQGLIGKYRLDWSGVPIQAGRQESEFSKPSHLGIKILATRLDKERKLEIRAYFSQFPFFTLEAGGANFYYAEANIPVDATWSAYKAIDKLGARPDFNLEVFVADPRTSGAFGITTRLLASNGEWHFDERGIIKGVKRLSRD
jgi:hypothetical protein